MKIILDNFDSKRIEQLYVTMQNNADVFEALADYVNNNEKFITSKMMQPFINEYDMLPQTAFAIYLSAACGLDTSENENHKKIYEDYFIPAVNCINPKKYLDNPYIKNVIFNNIKTENWEISKIEFQPYEAFVCNQPIQTSDFKEIPQIGFFETKTEFPAVFQNNREWMSLKPNEIETMEQPLENANGNVLIYGLGLGYFAYMASLKKSVKKITIVENNQEIIKLFENQLLNQFTESPKINIICNDAIDFANQEAEKINPDYVFADIWHDVGDGLSIYLKLKTLENKIPNAKFDYWIEKSMLSNLRTTVFFQMYKIFKSRNNKTNVKEKVIKNYNEFINYLSDDNLRKIKINFK